MSGYGNASSTRLVEELGKDSYYVVHVGDEEAVAMCHRLCHRDRLFVGPSSGATLAAVRKVLAIRPDLIPDCGHVVAVMPDGGRNYADTVFNNQWLATKGLAPLVSRAS